MTRGPDVTVRSPDGTPIAVFRSGRGDPLLLVHGAMSDHTRWDHLLDLLEPHATVFTMDRRGRGMSGDAPDGTYAIEREYEDTAAVVDAIAAETDAPVDVFGHSYGALCALEGARLTTNVSRLALYEPPSKTFEPPPGLLDRLEALIAAGRRDEAVDTFFRDAVRSPEEERSRLRSSPVWAVRVANIHTLVRELRAAGRYDVDPARLDGPHVPTLLLFGDAHPPELLEKVDHLVASLPGATSRALEGQGHMALDTDPAGVADQLLRFFDRTRGPDTPSGSQLAGERAPGEEPTSQFLG